ncbi:MAG: DNA mismatch repair endonuclease MutL [Candidatus Omnitrophica bacterium]|nr:DNA mismatch repair endonuclease MutL [Candidatus Omnitrophota bacterium]
MGRIRILPEDLVNKISAGEVVERPTSIVKELIENSLDAGGSKVVIEVEKGGSSLIRVSDDGYGIPKDDLMLVCERHATSKVHELSDLNNIRTFGFRGEALASIAGVSYMKITSYSKDEGMGWCLDIAGGINKKVKEIGCPPGTTVEVMHLFYNTPARKKFMKSIASEIKHITNITGIESLAHPEKGFKLSHNGRWIFTAVPTGDIRERIRAVYGNDLAIELLPVTFEDDVIKGHGFITKPSYDKKDRKYQVFFVNKRHVHSPVLSHAISEAYGTLLPSNRYAGAIIFIEIDPSLVDVNVHPTKKEVRFSEDKRLHDSLVRCVKDALNKIESIGGIPAGDVYGETNEDTDRSLRIKESIGRYLDKTGFETDLYRHPGESSATGKEGLKGIFLQARDLYLITYDADGIVIIDQHAAHERVLFEEFKKKSEGSRIESQRLLFPITLETSPLEAMMLETNIEVFHSIGFEIEGFGKNTFIINAVPAILRKHDPKKLLLDILDEITDDENGAGSLKNQTGEGIILAACRSAVKASDKLNEAEISGLIEKLKATDSFSTCPHGRPTVFRLTWAELEKRFKRK